MTSTTNKMRGLRTVVYLVLGLAVLPGCNKGWAAKDSPQGLELEAIARQHRHIQITVPVSVPVAFDGVAIDKQTTPDGTSYRAVAVWKMTASAEEVRSLLHTLVVAKNRGFADREVEGINLIVRYQDPEGKECGSDKILLDLSHDKDKVELPNIGKQGSPVSGTATLESFILRERQITVPAN